MASGGAWTVQPFVSLSPSVSRRVIGDPLVLLHTAFAVNSHKYMYIYCTCTFSLTPSPPHTLIPHLHLSPPPLPSQVWLLPGYVSLCSECTLMSTAIVAHSPLQPPPPPPPTPHSPHSAPENLLTILNHM